MQDERPEIQTTTARLRAERDQRAADEAAAAPSSGDASAEESASDEHDVSAIEAIMKALASIVKHIVAIAKMCRKA